MQRWCLEGHLGSGELLGLLLQLLRSFRQQLVCLSLHVNLATRLQPRAQPVSSSRECCRLSDTVVGIVVNTLVQAQG